MSVSRTVSEILRMAWIWNRGLGSWRSLKMAPFDRPYTTFYSISIYLFHCKYSCMLYRFRVMWRWMIMTLKSGLEVTQDHSNRYHLKAWVRFPIRLP